MLYPFSLQAKTANCFMLNGIIFLGRWVELVFLVLVLLLLCRRGFHLPALCPPPTPSNKTHTRSAALCCWSMR